MINCRYSLYTLLWFIVVATVLAVTTVNAFFSYDSARSRILEETSQYTHVTMASLRKNIANYIESYAIHEYENLVLNEMNHVVFLAIIIHDYNMGAVLGQEAYVSGKIRDSSGQVIDFDPENQEMLQQLEASVLPLTVKMTSAAGQELGTVSLYGSKEKIEQELQKVIKESLT
ncbi:MAG: hypothetical protein D3909_18960, partial [Candidatus Electrothrix sp. ATG1]|nr:hypothetical protein [Candidatus Electrothrix sp. ATG1]